MPQLSLTFPLWAWSPPPQHGWAPYFAQAQPEAATRRAEGRGELGRGGSWLCCVASGAAPGSVSL